MDKISVPRAAVEALVDPAGTPYLQFDGYVTVKCAYCQQIQPGKQEEHLASCPVRIIQEALAQPQPPTFTDTEYTYLRAIVSNWVDEGFTRPPYDAEVYSIIAKLGMTQADFTQPYDVTPPQETP